MYLAKIEVLILRFNINNHWKWLLISFSCSWRDLQISLTRVNVVRVELHLDSSFCELVARYFSLVRGCWHLFPQTEGYSVKISGGSRNGSEWASSLFCKYFQTFIYFTGLLTHESLWSIICNVYMLFWNNVFLELKSCVQSFSNIFKT